MNTKGIKFLAVLTVLAMAFAATAVLVNEDSSDAAAFSVKADKSNLVDTSVPPITKLYTSFEVSSTAGTGYTTVNVKISDLQAHKNGEGNIGYWAGCSFIPSDQTVKVEYKVASTQAGLDEIDYKKNNGDGSLDVNANGSENGFAIYKTANVPEFWVALKWYDGTLDKAVEQTYFVKQDISVVHSEDVNVNVTGDYIATSNADLGNSVSIVRAEEVTSDLFAEYTINAKLAYVEDLKAAGMDVGDEDQYKYALIWQIKNLESYDNFIGSTVPFSMKWNPDKTEWIHKQASEKSGAIEYFDQETFVVYFEDKTTMPDQTSTAYLYFAPVDMQSENTVGSSAAKIKLNFNVSFIKSSQIITDVDDVKEALDNTDNKTVELVTDSATATFPADTKVSDDQTLVVMTTGTGTISGNLIVGTNGKAISLDKVKGTVEISKGSIIINAVEWTGGEVIVNEGDVVKIYGTGSGDLKISSVGDKAASVIIEADKELVITGTGFTLGKGLTLTVDGKLIASNLTTEAKVTVNGTLNVTNDVAGAFNCKKALDVYGELISKNKINNGDNVVIYYTGDVNEASFIDYSKVVGKDAASGKWTYDEAKSKLILNNYNGKYNFGFFSDAIQTIEVIGDNCVFVVAEKPDIAFENVTTITADEGTLTINVDVSAFTEEQMAAGSHIFKTTGNVTLNQVSLFIFVEGSNSAWTTDCIKTAKITGFEMSGDLTMYYSSFVIDVFGKTISDEAKGIFGLVAANLGMVSSNMTVIAAGYGITGSDDAVPAKVNEFSAVSATDVIKVTGGIQSIRALNLSILGSIAVVTGDAEIDVFGVSNESAISIDGKLTTGSMTVDKKSAVILKDLIVNTKIDNEATITVMGTSEVWGTITNKNTETGNPVFINAGDMYVYGHILNEKGTFTNNGTLAIQKYKNNAWGDTNKDITVAAGGEVSASKVKVTAIELQNKTVFNANGTSDVEARVTFALNTTDAATYSVAEGFDVFTGTFVPSQIDGKYTMTLRNGNATIIVAYNLEKTTVSVSGSITVWETADHTKTKLFDIQALADGYTVTDEVKTLPMVTNADLKISGGAFVNTDGVFVYSGAYAAATPFLDSGATYTGNLDVGSEAMYIKGTMTGSILSAGVVEIKGTLDGNLTAEAATISGTVKNGTIFVEHGVDASNGKITDGKIIAKEGVNVKEMTGDIEINGKTADVNVTFNKLTGDIIFNSTYNTDEPVPPATPTTETVTSTMTIAADSTGTTIILKGAVNKAGSTAGAPGYFILNKDSGAASTDKTVDIKLTAGKLIVAESTVLMKGYVLTIEADTTIEISDKNATLTASGAALKVSKDAIAHFEEGSATPVNYGKVAYIMKFDISEGYTIYSNIAYALSNSDEGSTLTMGQSDTVDSNVTIGEGIKVIVPKDVVLTFDGHDVDMAATASIVLVDNGKVIFKHSGDNSDDPEMKKGDLITYYSVTGTIVFDEDNAVYFKDARFTAEADTVISGLAATSTEDSKLNVTIYIEAGEARISEGNATGNVKLTNNHYAVFKGDEEKDHLLVSAAFGVDFGAVFDAVSITDIYATVEYKAYTDPMKPEIKGYKSLASYVDIDGTLNLKDSTVANGAWIADGTVTLADKKTFTIFEGQLPAPGEVKKVLANVSMASLVDTTDDQNGYSLVLVSPLMSVEYDMIAPLVFTAKEYKIDGTNTKVMSISGALGIGAIAAKNAAVLEQFIIFFDTSVVADVTYVMGDGAVAAGDLCTKEIYMKEEGVTGYGELIYQVTFEKEGYTVYTSFQNVDLDEISDIVIAGNKDEYELSELVKDGTTKVDLSGKDVNITVAEGKTLIIDIPLILGTPIDSLGADEGSSISGKIVIKASNDNDLGAGEYAYRYVVLYSDVDFLDAEFYQADEKTEAVYSFLTIEDIVYATIIANEGEYDAGAAIAVKYGAGVGLAIADKTLIPDIEGYVFTKWSNLNDDPNAAVGETSAYANAKAILVTVIVKFAEGVSYYLDGVEFAIYDTPTKVDYNSVFTAKINNTAKYEGTPLINGKNSFIVTEDATLNVTGVNPIPVPPEPEPEPVVGDSGLSLTDILLIVLVILIAIMVVILVLRLNRS